MSGTSSQNKIKMMLFLLLLDIVYLGLVLGIAIIPPDIVEADIKQMLLVAFIGVFFGDRALKWWKFKRNGS